MKDRVRAWLEDGTVDIFLGYRWCEGHPLPHVFSKNHLEEIDELVTGPARYPLETIARQMAARQPDLKIGIIARDCNLRALNVLYIWNRLDPKNVKTMDVTCCPSNLKDHADCSYSEPQRSGMYKSQVGIDNRMELTEVEYLSPQERFARWTYEFDKCIKCYGCRDICPVCFCEECSLQHPDLVGNGPLPAEVPIFHLVRAVHMAGRCIDCGLCEDACPVDIPLRLLYRKANTIVNDLFGYETGTGADLPPFNVLEERVPLEPKPLGEAPPAEEASTGEDADRTVTGAA